MIETTSSTPYGRSRGFTLIELLIVLLVIGISAAVLLPALLENSYRAKVQNAANQTAIQMRLARYRAIREGREFGVFADFTTNRVSLFDGDAPGTEAGGFELPTGIRFQHPADGGPNGNMAVAGFEEDASGGWAVFGPDGSSEFALNETEAWVAFAMPERSQYFRVYMGNAATANIRVERWNGSTWEG